jgi:RHS repeat-associated protein
MNFPRSIRSIGSCLVGAWVPGRELLPLFCVWMLLRAAAVALPTAEPPSITVNVGEEVSVLIYPPDDVTGPKSIIKLVSPSSSSVVGVTPALGVEIRPTGRNPAKFIIKGLVKGSTSLTINWKDAVQSYSGNVVVGVLILAPPESTANFTPVVEIGDPVNARNGEYFALEKVDLNLGGPMPLFFARYYASKLSTDSRVTSALFSNRLHTFDSRMVVPSSGRRDVLTNRGRVISFEQKGSLWTLIRRTDIAYQFVASGANFILADPRSQRMWTYDGTSGRLLKIEDGRGNTHTLTYTTVAPIRLQQVADGLGRTLTFTYNLTDKLSRVTDHTGQHVDFGYTSISLTSAIDPLGHTTTCTNTSITLLTSFMRPEGNVPFTQVYTSGKVSSQTERGTDTGTMAYVGTTTTFTQPGGTTLVDEFSATGQLTAHTDEAGETIALTNDATGRRNSVTDREGDKTTILYHALSGKPASITNAEGRVTTMTYSTRLLNGVTFYDLAKLTQPDGASLTLTRDKKGSVTAVVDQVGKKWTYTRNERGQVLTATNPLGGVSVYGYDTAGNLASSKDADTSPTTYLYDTLSRLTTITRPGGATATFTYDAADRLLSMTDERGKTRTFTYDNNDRLTIATDPDANTTQFAYDTLDRVQQVTDRLGATSSVTYDPRRLLSTVIDRNGNATGFTHDPLQRPVTTTDAGGKTWTRTFDAEGLAASAQNPVDARGTLKRNALGRVVEAADPLGHTVRVARDTMQRVVQKFDPLGRATTYTYDKLGQLTGAAEQGTGAAKYDRDPLGNVSRITDPNGSAWACTYTKAGRLAVMTDPLGRKSTHTYDPRGRLAVTTFADATTETRSYDDANHLTRRQFTDGTELIFTHDNLGRLATANGVEFSYDAEGRLTNCRQNASDFNAAYDAGGRLTSVRYLSGAVIVTYTYDVRDRLTRVSDNVSAAQIDFAYDDAGRMTSMTRSNGVNATFTHDGAGRLTRIVEGAAIDLMYTLNAAGEVIETDYNAPLVPSAAPGTNTFTFDKAAQIISTGFTHDARGRRTASPSGAFAWDGAGRLTSAAGVALAYNGLGDIVSRTTGAGTTTFAHHYALGLAPIVVETPPAVAAARYYIWTPGGQLLYSFESGANSPTFYHFDRIGSTLALSDAAGVITDSYAYGPFGEAAQHTGTSTQPFTYVGAWGVRAEGALFDMRARHYDPATARFLSRDPAPISLTNPKRLNLYEYAAQNPGSFIDPRGLRDEVAQLADGIQDYAGQRPAWAMILMQPFSKTGLNCPGMTDPSGRRYDPNRPPRVKVHLAYFIPDGDCSRPYEDGFIPPCDDFIPDEPLQPPLPLTKPDGCGTATAGKLIGSSIADQCGGDILSGFNTGTCPDSRPSSSEKRALNWTAIFDEVADFDANVRGTAQ